MISGMQGSRSTDSATAPDISSGMKGLTVTLPKFHYDITLPAYVGQVEATTIPIDNNALQQQSLYCFLVTINTKTTN